MNKTIIIFHGWSGVGKSEACKYVAKQYGAYNFHPIRFLKTQLEDHYDLPYGWLDEVEGKQFIPENGSGKTMQSIMVALYHFWKENDPLYSTRNFPHEVPQALETHGLVVMQAIRNLAEVKAIEKIVEQQNAKVIYIWLSRSSAKRETSDEFALEIDERLGKLADVDLVIENDTDDIRNLYSAIDQIIKENLHV